MDNSIANFQVYNRNRKWFLTIFLIIEILAVISLILIGVWTGTYLGGFSWRTDPHKEFNYHPLFMVIGFIILYGNGMLVYRLMKHYEKLTLKIIHALHFAGTFIFGVIALIAVFDSHNLREKPTANLYTLHSWIGLGAVIIFSAQLVLGFFLYLLPCAPRFWRQLFMPSHRYFGIAIYLLSVASCLTGITEKILFRIEGKGYQKLPALAVIGNAISIILVVKALLVVYLVTSLEYKRDTLVDEEPMELNGY